MRLIDADVLNNSIYHEAFETDSELQKWDSGCWIRYKMFENHLDNAPTIDAAPVVRGEWRWHEEWKESTSDGPAECQGAGYVCSVCGIELSEYLSESLGEIIYADNPEETPKITFCPSCGAKMEDKP